MYGEVKVRKLVMELGSAVHTLNYNSLLPGL